MRNSNFLGSDQDNMLKRRRKETRIDPNSTLRGMFYQAKRANNDGEREDGLGS